MSVSSHKVILLNTQLVLNSYNGTSIVQTTKGLYNLKAKISAVHYMYIQLFIVTLIISILFLIKI